MKDAILYLTFYVVFAYIFGFIIIKHNSKKDSRWLVTPKMNLQRSKPIYWLCWLTLIFLTLMLLNFFVTSTIIQGLFIGGSLLLVIPIFLSFPVLLIIFGIKSIKGKENIEYSSYSSARGRGTNPVSVYGGEAILNGIKYIVLGVMLLSMMASLIGYASCRSMNSGIVCKALGFISLPFEYSSRVLGLFHLKR